MNQATLMPRAIFAVPILTILVACEVQTGAEDEAPIAPTSDAATPALVSIPGGDVRLGFKNGRLRKNTRLEGFRITKTPITNAQYKDCISSQVCEPPPELACSREAREELEGIDLNSDKAPAICVGYENAESFCRWIGGRLPSLAEWWLAARGKMPRRFSWGDRPPECDQHPFADVIRERVIGVAFRPGEPRAKRFDGVGTKCDRSDKGIRSLSVGEYPDGASPFGVEDVLLTPGELLRPDGDAMFPACGRRYSGCVSFGLVPGAIDSVEPVDQFIRHESRGENAPSSSIAHAYSFRCVFEEN